MIQPVHVDLFHTGAWNSITDDVYTRAPIQVTRGQGDEWTSAGPATASMTADNRDGTYNPRNPTSALYGAVGRNTPARIHLGVPHPGAAASSLVASTSHVAPSVDAPTSSGLLICAWSGPFPSGSYTAPGSMTESLDQSDAVQTMMAARQIISGAGATGTRTATSSASETWLAASVLIHGPTSITTGAAGIAGNQLTVDGNTGDWWILIASSGWDDSDLPPSAFPWDTDGGGWILLADTGSVNSGDADAAFNQMKVWAKQVRVTDAAHTVAVVEPTGMDTILYFTRVPAAEIDSVWSIRAHGEISSWVPRRAIKGDAWTELVASGPTRRLGQGQDPLRSALRRYIGARSPVAYWSFEEGSASQFISLTAGSGTAFTRYLFSGKGTFEPGTGELAPWSGAGGLLRGVVTMVAKVGMANSPTQWAVDFIVKGDSLSGGDVLSLIMDGPAGDGTDSWQIDMYASLNEIDIFEPGPGSNAATYPGLFDGNAQRHIRFATVQNGANVDYTLYINGAVVVTDSATTVTLGPIRQILFSPGADGVAIGDLVIWSTPPAIADTYAASTGYTGETAGRRFLRLCQEEDITAAIVGNPDDTVPLGPQFPDTLLNLLHEIEATDDGIVHDAREFLGVAYRTGRSRYNQDAALTLDHAAFRVAPPTDPVIDDQVTRNDVTASRREGSSARAVQESGPLNVNDPSQDPEGVGRYSHQVNVNSFSDLVLPDFASWHLHRGTVDETRWPTVTVDLDAFPSLAGPVSAVNIGDRITVTNMPAELSPDTVTLIVVGYQETLGSHRRLITFTCIPESQFHVSEVAHSLYKFVGSDSATTNEALDTTETGVDIVCGAGHDWVREVDFDILIGGERMTVSAVGAASGTYPNRTQTLTVTRSVNGVVKAHASGVRVDFFHKTFIGI